MGNLPRSMRAKSLQDYSMMPSCSARLARGRDVRGYMRTERATGSGVALRRVRAECGSTLSRSRPCSAGIRDGGTGRPSD
jgi:hypothetical protein